MLFGSFEFLLGFLPVTLLIYHWLRVGGRRQWAKLFLVAASLFFYGWWDWRYVPLVMASVGANFGLSLAMERAGSRARLVAAIGIVLNLSLLAYYKYANFFVANLHEITGWEVPFRRVVLPLAISFFTFQQIAYLVEAYRDRKAAESFTDYCLFVLFFPHLIAGPITHHKEMLPQFHRAGAGPLPMSYITVGLTILVLGLAKKAVIADSLAEFANPVFHSADLGRDPSFANAWLGATAYTLQLYFDFSGYSDMAIGLGLLFGIRMPVNFASPYRSTSIIEFWRRWHISLSRFLRNYLYIPLGGNRHGEVRRHVNLLITMALGGLWHGAGWTFLAWGVLHGVYLVANHLFRQATPKRDFGRAGAALGWALTMGAVVVAWVLFRAGTFEGAMRILHGMAWLGFGGGADDLAAPLPVAWLAVLAAGAAAVFMPNVLEMTRYPDSTPGLPVEADGLRPVAWRAPAMATAALVGVIAAFAIAKLPDPGVFLYFNF